MTRWRDFFAEHQVDGQPLFSEECRSQLQAHDFNPSDADRIAAGRFHTQLISRISTQALGYFSGVEEAALSSLHQLFDHARRSMDENPGCAAFEILLWDVINHRLRPFTAQWHREASRGILQALDSTDDFRSELAVVQKYLRAFDRSLVHLRDGTAPEVNSGSPSTGREDELAAEMRRPIEWGISEERGNLPGAVAKQINAAERTAIQGRRRHYGLVGHTPHATALALSGGGIRSATFSLGVLVALGKRGILPQFDYLSTVSGGGYLGAFLSAFLNAPKPPNEPKLGLGAKESPMHGRRGEAEPLRYLRHHCRYLTSGSLWGRLLMVAAQLQGMILNGVGLVVVLAAFAGIEAFIRENIWDPSLGRGAAIMIAWMIAGTLLVALLLLRLGPRARKVADWLCLGGILGVGVVALVGGLGTAHHWFHHAWMIPGSLWQSAWPWHLVLGVMPLIGSAVLALFGRVLGQKGLLLAACTAGAAVVFFLGIYLVAFEAIHLGDLTPVGLHVSMDPGIADAVILGAFLFYYFFFDVNATSPHRSYRNRLARTFLIQPDAVAGERPRIQPSGHVKLSGLGSASQSAPYQLINCALNVPSTKNPQMQGRLTDFFLFSAAYTGSPLTGYYPTAEWEKRDGHLDLGTAMAISGAAASPQMGLGTQRSLSFWLALLNVRLGYWARRPHDVISLSSLLSLGHGGTPGLWFLLREMFGWIDETLPWYHLSDGGHIENLGVYELLRRRCKFIVAVDGEQDSQMTFSGFTTLQRFAAIDLGVKIDVDLDDLRLTSTGLSRSHFRFARIFYPTSDPKKPEIGYLLYVKLSLTGNEGEFIRRYRLDEPVFPHHSTADQFFTEVQFEAYRTLGEHIGDKLFMPAIMGGLGDASDLTIEQWFEKFGLNLLEPRGS